MAKTDQIVAEVDPEVYNVTPSGQCLPWGLYSTVLGAKMAAFDAFPLSVRSEGWENGTLANDYLRRVEVEAAIEYMRENPDPPIVRLSIDRQTPPNKRRHPRAAHRRVR